MIEHAYIHIPFCLRKCKYCSFISGQNIENKDIYIAALIKEIKNRYNNEELKTIYFGGGTPSLLDENDFQKILSLFNVENNAEITIEVNPETVEKTKILGLKKLGVNRISLGVQTFNNNILGYIGRQHNENKIYHAVDTIKSAGFKNISIDLIYGLPTQTLEMFKKDLDKAIELEIQHISTYGLKIEKGSFFFHNPPDNLPDDEMQATMFLFLCDFLKKNNFEHYEISNFALKGFESRHNICYWKNKNYYGFGLNASGFEQNIRYKNQSDFNDYIKNPLKREEEIFLTFEENLENEIFLALRLKDGININNINKKFNIDFLKKYEKIIKKYKKLNLLSVNKDNINLTENGILLSNEIMSEFLL